MTDTEYVTHKGADQNVEFRIKFAIKVFAKSVREDQQEGNQNHQHCPSGVQSPPPHHSYITHAPQHIADYKALAKALCRAVLHPPPFHFQMIADTHGG